MIATSADCAVPAHPEALRQSGAAWLTRAFHAYGSLSPDNAVTAITAAADFAAGNSGSHDRGAGKSGA